MSLPVIYNRCYGGFNFSEAAIARYNELIERTGGDKLTSTFSEDRRTDRVMAMVVGELKESASGYCSKLGIAWVDEKFGDYIMINEYDGSECVSIDFPRYRLEKIQEIVFSKEPDAWKLARIEEILVEEEPEVKYGDDI